MLGSTNRPNFLALTSWDMVVFFQVYGVIDFEISFNFLIKLFFYMPKKSGKKFKYSKDEKRF